VLLQVPIVGPCLRALALTRFCLALRLTQETGMSILKALRLSLRATGNAAYEGRTEAVQAVLKEGEDLARALSDDRLFPEEFRNIVAVAEESGRVPEVMRQQAAYYEEEAGRRMSALAAAAGWGVWAIVAALIIVAIFRIFFTYLGQFDKIT
jgi:type IV pilus assembly protein PilC